MPFDPVVFATDGIFNAVERLVHDASAVSSTASKRGAVAGIEIEVEVVGPIDVVAGRVPLIEVDAAEIDHPHQRRTILDHRESR